MFLYIDVVQGKLMSVVNQDAGSLLKYVTLLNRFYYSVEMHQLGFLKVSCQQTKAPTYQGPEASKLELSKRRIQPCGAYFCLDLFSPMFKISC